jgi:hypothetical protein
MCRHSGDARIVQAPEAPTRVGYEEYPRLTTAELLATSESTLAGWLDEMHGSTVLGAQAYVEQDGCKVFTGNYSDAGCVLRTTCSFSPVPCLSGCDSDEACCVALISSCCQPQVPFVDGHSPHGGPLASQPS